MTDSNTAITTTPAKGSSWVRSFVERAKGEIKQVPSASKIEPYVKAAGGTIRGLGEGVVVGSLIGTARATFGDEVADTAAGVVMGGAALASVAMADAFPGFSQDIRNAGIAAAGIMGDRKVSKWLGRGSSATKPAAQSAKAPTPKGPGVEDPILKAAQKLG